MTASTGNQNGRQTVVHGEKAELGHVKGHDDQMPCQMIFLGLSDQSAVDFDVESKYPASGIVSDDC